MKIIENKLTLNYIYTYHKLHWMVFLAFVMKFLITSSRAMLLLLRAILPFKKKKKVQDMFIQKKMLYKLPEIVLDDG